MTNRPEVKGFVDDLLAMFCAFNALKVESFTQEELQKYIYMFFEEMGYPLQHPVLLESSGRIPVISMAFAQADGHGMMDRKYTLARGVVYYPGSIPEAVVVKQLGGHPNKLELMKAVVPMIRMMTHMGAIEMVAPKQDLATAHA